MRIRGDDLEGLRDLLCVGASTDVQKVGGLSTVELDDVHGGHGQAGSVHQAANRPIQANVVQASLGGLHLAGVLLGVVSHGEHFLLPEVGVVVKVDLGVHAGD